ncbi:hypothetical protein HPG69_001667 [Diceros bicornis minor]|uniref:Serine/threonine-protein phosphatase 2A 55 kDa regulatory subunit B n=1 Tax=Diceros bicornis minor TaxID=77932 RepID=A0A7J7FH62_DICBM|nr:hypothetical protein HPG69_001667 [Diceros bicornis minor]
MGLEELVVRTPNLHRGADLKWREQCPVQEPQHCWDVACASPVPLGQGRLPVEGQRWGSQGLPPLPVPHSASIYMSPQSCLSCLVFVSLMKCAFILISEYAQPLILLLNHLLSPLVFGRQSRHFLVALKARSADIISTVEFNHTGELLATGDKGGRVVIFQREPESKNAPHSQGEYDVYSTFQSHEPEFDYLKSLEIEEKINKIKWLPQQNAAHSLLSTNDKTIKLWKITERDKRPEGYNLKDEEGKLKDLSTVTSLQVPVLKPMDLMVEVSPRRVFANGHTYHINSISVNSDCETYMSADDLRINLWHLAITDRSFSILSSCRPPRHLPGTGFGWGVGGLVVSKLTWGLLPCSASSCVSEDQMQNQVEFIYENFKTVAAEWLPEWP